MVSWRRGRRSSSKPGARGSRCSSATCSCCSASSRCSCSGRRAAPTWSVGLGYGLVGVGVGFAGTPASRSLTGSVPVTRAGMASGTADLQRDLGGAIMQSIFGALLTAGYAAAAAAAIAGAPPNRDITRSVQSQLTMSFAGAEAIAAQYPQYSTQITAAAKEAFLAGDQWAYIAGIVAVLLGAALVVFKFPQEGRGAAPPRGVPGSGLRGATPPSRRG